MKLIYIGLIHVLSRRFPGGTEENKTSNSQDSRCPDRVSNRASFEYKSEALPLEPIFYMVTGMQRETDETHT